MSEPFIGEIRMFGGNFAPQGWAFCNGQVLPISQYDALFALIGTTYGGDGQATFALPDLRGRLPMHQSGSYPIGEVLGTETVTLTTPQIPVHSHTVAAKATANATSPTGGVYGGNAAVSIYSTQPPSAPMNAAMVGIGGGSQPHDNMMPFAVVSFIIALQGIFPTRN